MKDFPQVGLEASRPGIAAKDAIEHALDRLYKDRRHVVTDQVVVGLTFEELIGALLLARDTVEQLEDDS